MSVLRVNNIDTAGLLDVVTNGVVEKRALPSGSVLQVVSTAKTNTFSASLTGSAEAEITGLNATITPTSSSSKILIMVSLHGSSTNYGGCDFNLYRDATKIAQADAGPGGTIQRTGYTLGDSGTGANTLLSINFLDSPATTSAITYKVYASQVSTGGTIDLYVNRTSSDYRRVISTITVMEIAG